MKAKDFDHKVYWISGQEVRTLLDMESVIDVVRDAMKTVSHGKTELPMRGGMPIADSGNALGMMPGALLDDDPVFGIKLVSLFPGNSEQGLPSHMGLYVLFEAQNGKPIAVMNGNEVTAIRTAAASAVATAALARTDSRVLTILGTGEQAAAHLNAITKVRNLHEIRIWGRYSDRAQAQALAHTDDRATAINDIDAAISGTDILCTVTSAVEPLVTSQQLSQGMHINAVGASHANAMEIAPEALASCSVFIDYEGSAREQAGEIIRAVEAGHVTGEVFRNEIGRVLSGDLAGRQSDTEITLYKSLGVAAQDLVTARLGLTLAAKRGVGTLVSL